LRPGARGFLDALEGLQRALENSGRPYLIIGGVAVIAAGIPRLTLDIDATLPGGGLELDELAQLLAAHDIDPRIEDAVEFARSRRVYLAVHTPSGVPVDLSLAALPFELEAIDSGKECDYSGVSIRVARPEDLVIYKLVAARPRDLEDAEALLVLHGATMNLERVRDIVGSFAAALDDDTRSRALDELLRRTGFRS
jgi:hypothetical protein